MSRRKQSAGAMVSPDAIGSIANHDLDQAAQRIRDLVGTARTCIIMIGQELIATSGKVPQGQWEQWLKDEFGWAVSTARAYIRVAQSFPSLTGSDSMDGVTIDAKALYALSAPDVPQEVRDEAVARAQDGEHITRADAEDMVRKALSKQAEAVERAIKADEKLREKEVKKRIAEATKDLRDDKQALAAEIKTINDELRSPDLKTIAAVICKTLGLKKLNDTHYRLLAQMTGRALEAEGKTYAPIATEELARIQEGIKLAGTVTDAMAALAGAAPPEALLTVAYPVQRKMIREHLDAVFAWLEACEEALKHYDPDEKV